MNSFNFDYIFNLVYNFFLAIRYAVLFWVLGIDKNTYLLDHQNDTWDGLRDKNWLSTTPDLASQSNSTIYLGGEPTTNSLSWWDIVKDKIFGIGGGEKASGIYPSHSSTYNLNPSEINFLTEKTNHQSWFSNLRFSIQNPILAFLADLISILSFFVILLIIYSLIKWVLLVVKPKHEEKIEKTKEQNKDIFLEKLDYQKVDIQDHSRPVATLPIRVVEKIREENILQEEKKIENSMPAGIPGLPIDDSELDKKELELLSRKKDMLLNYESKNIFPKKENQILKVKEKPETYFQNLGIIKNEELDKKGLEVELNKRERIAWYQNRWQIVLGYMEGDNDALWRIGILEADNLLDQLLEEKGYYGSTLSDKLSQVNLKTIDLAWAAHKMRNRVAHEGAKLVLTERIARNTLEQFRAVFTELKIFE